MNMAGSNIDRFVTKIEGHGHIEADFSSSSVKLSIDEGERLFEGIVVGKRYEDVHFITPRICGVCPTAHNIASIRGIEAAFGVKPTETAIALRKAMLAAQIVQSHTLHLFFLSLPDYLGIDSATGLAAKNPKLLKVALSLKNASDALLKAIGGRQVHPTTTIVGGFTRFPTQKEVEASLKLIARTMKDAEAARDACAKAVGDFAPFHRETEYLSLDDYYGDSDVLTSKGEEFNPSDYDKNISEAVKLYSSAKYGTRHEHGFLVGAMARQINAGRRKQTGNTFENNVAQGEEIVEFLAEAQRNLEKAASLGLKRDELAVEFEPKEGVGVGALEAPRGTLYHKFWFDSEGFCTKADIITPTAQNLTNIEEDANAILAQNKDKSQAELQRLLEMLVRAYDPCITCSVH